MELSDDLLKLIYGDDINIFELRKIKNRGDMWNDITLFLAKDDITKMDEIKKMRLKDVLDVLKLKVETKKINKTKIEMPKIGYKRYD